MATAFTKQIRGVGEGGGEQSGKTTSRSRQILISKTEDIQYTYSGLKTIRSDDKRNPATINHNNKTYNTYYREATMLRFEMNKHLSRICEENRKN